MKHRIMFAALMACALIMQAPVAFAAPAPTPVTLPAQTASGSASDVVKTLYAHLEDTMKQGDQLGYNGRFKKLQPVVQAAYDMPYMTRLAVGLTWSKATPDEQQQLIAAFSDFSAANYAHNFAKSDGEKFEVTGEKSFNDGVIVETKLTPKGKEPIALNYLMHKDDKGVWKIVDVYLDGSISELATRRSEFSAIANHDGIPTLINSLGEKSKSMGPS